MSHECPKVFISYAWETDEHKLWVKHFADCLIDSGLDAAIDQYDLTLGDRLPAFMEKCVTEADYVLIICTPKYKQKSDAREGGVGYEGHIISGELFAKGNERKFIPIIKGDPSYCLPIFLSGKLGIVLPDAESYTESSEYIDLIATLWGSKSKPPIGKKPAYIASNKIVDKSSAEDPVSICGIITNEVTMPRLDGTRGSALYKIPFRLNKNPSSLWKELFIRSWNNPPQFTMMHRPRIASVYGDRIILDGTTIEEVRDIHRETLKLCVEEANKNEQKLLQQEMLHKQQEQEHKNKHYGNINEIADEIIF